MVEFETDLVKVNLKPPSQGYREGSVEATSNDSIIELHQGCVVCHINASEFAGHNMPVGSIAKGGLNGPHGNLLLASCDGSPTTEVKKKLILVERNIPAGDVTKYSTPCKIDLVKAYEARGPKSRFHT